MQTIPNSDGMSWMSRMVVINRHSMTASGRTHPAQHWLAALLAVWIALLPVTSARAWPWGEGNPEPSRRSADVISPSSPSGRLQEVSPPGAVQQLKTALGSHQPRLQLIDPSDGALLGTDQRRLVLLVEDWPLAEDPQLGLGAHVALQIDDQPPLRFSQAENDRLLIDLPPLSPGSHRFCAYAAMPWGEAVKSSGASLQWRLDVLQKLAGTQPERDAPWLTVVSPSDLNGGEPLLLDWLVWNAPLQNLREGDDRWRLRISVNGDSFFVDHQEALWIKGAAGRTGGVQMELLDGLGEPITPAFNNQLRAVTTLPGARPAWMQPRLNEAQMARLLGEPIAEADPSQEDPNQDQEPEAEIALEQSSRPDIDAESYESERLNREETPASEMQSEARQIETTDKTTDRTTKRNSDADDVLDTESKPETGTAPNDEAATVTAPESTAPASSLGGSARELLNAHGTQR